MGYWMTKPRMTGPRNDLHTSILRLEKNAWKGPIFGTLQLRSARVIYEMLESGKFKDGDTLATAMAGLVNRVNFGLEGKGSLSQRLTLPLQYHVPHETTIVTGSFIHIPQDIGGGLDDCLKKLRRLPNAEDYREMYAAVRGSLRTVSSDLFALVGANTTTTSVYAMEKIIVKTGRDPVMWLRDRQYGKRGGEIAPGLPSDDNIKFAVDSIKANPKSAVPIFDIRNYRKN